MQIALWGPYTAISVPQDITVHELFGLERTVDAAWAAYDSDRAEEVERLCRELIASYPDQFDGYEILGALREQQKRWSEAAEHFEQALRVAQREAEHFSPGVLDQLESCAEHARRHAAESEEADADRGAGAVGPQASGA